MATDNVTLNAGTGGSTIRTLADASGNEWPTAAACYATAVSPGANVLQVVTTSAGLPVAQQGTWTVGVSGAVAVTGTFWQATQPVSAASLPLPTGAAADASVNGILVSQGSTTSGEKGPLVQGAVTAAAPSYTTAQTSPLSLDTSGNLRVLAAISGALPAGTNLLGQVAAGQQVASLFSGTTAVTPQYAPITASTSGATTVVAAVANKRIYILRWSLSANGNVNVNWQSHATTGTATGLHYMTQYATAGGAYCPAGIFATALGEALDINLSAAVAVGGELTYAQF